MRIAVPRETLPAERRVALTPDAVARLVKAGHAVAIARGAGVAASFPDAAYATAGATLGDDDVVNEADVVARVRRPERAEIARYRQGTTVVALLAPGSPGAGAAGSDDETLALLASAGVSALALELVPRITRAQSMDVLSSQSTVAGYKAVLLGAVELGKFLPMLTTAAGSIPPAKAFVLGAGVAGLQAIATARRLGAIVSAFDVRPAAREQVLSLGATFVAAEQVTATAEAAGGYARAQTAEEQAATQRALAAHLRDVDLVVTTAQIPGRPAPRLLTEEMILGMKPGSVIVDLAAESGGNAALTRPGERVETPNGVVILGPVNVSATLPVHASAMFARNVLTLLQHLAAADGTLRVDPADEITGAMLVVHAGAVRDPRAATAPVAPVAPTSPAA